jgi:hypothetical protein
MSTFTSNDIENAMRKGRSIYEEYEVDPDHPARPMVVVFDTTGNHWLCDKGVNARANLAEQGCWRCGDPRFQFSRQN